MTANQIAYWKLQEESRANRVQEAENYRHNKATEFISVESIMETRRHNIVNEGIATTQTEEQIRANLERERLQHESNLFNREVGMANVSVQSARAAEEARHNAAMEEYSYYKANQDYEISSRTVSDKEKGTTLREEELYGGTDTRETEQARHNKTEENLHGMEMVFKGLQIVPGLMFGM